MTYQEYLDQCDPDVIKKWLITYIGHEHLADIKQVSLEKYLAVAPDVYVLAAMLQSVLRVAEEQREYGEYGQEDYSLKLRPWNELTAEEKISELELRKYYLAGMRAGRDSACIEMSNRITYAARQRLNEYRLENPEFDPAQVVDDHPSGVLE